MSEAFAIDALQVCLGLSFRQTELQRIQEYLGVGSDQHLALVTVPRNISIDCSMLALLRVSAFYELAV